MPSWGVAPLPRVLDSPSTLGAVMGLIIVLTARFILDGVLLKEKARPT